MCCQRPKSCGNVQHGWESRGLWEEPRRAFVVQSISALVPQMVGSAAGARGLITCCPISQTLPCQRSGLTSHFFPGQALPFPYKLPLAFGLGFNALHSLASPHSPSSISCLHTFVHAGCPLSLPSLPPALKLTYLYLFTLHIDTLFVYPSLCLQLECQYLVSQHCHRHFI